MHHRALGVLLLSGALAQAVHAQSSAGQTAGVREVGSQRVLLVDDWLIERMKGASLKLHSPAPKEVVFRFDRPWEGQASAYPSMLQDGKQFRLYYRGCGFTEREYVCVAFSDDGINWTRPSLKLLEFKGSKDNNIVWTGEKKAYCESHNFSPFRDDNPASPENQRYKAVALKVLVPPGETESRKVLVGLTSPDGIHWDRMGRDAIITDGSFDSHNVAFWDTVRREYVCYLRIGRDGKRSVARATSKDFLHWTKSEPLDFGDTPLEHFYTNGIEPYFRNPNLYIGFPMRFVPPQERHTVGLERRQIDGTSDMVFMSSQDGLRWNRRFMEAFVRPGLDPYNWGGAHGNCTPAWHVVQTGEAEMSIYWLERYGYHILWMPGKKPGSYDPKLRSKEQGAVDAQMRRGTLRLDGFVSVNAPYQGGEMLTRPFEFKGKQLLLNLSTSAVGSVKVEIQDTTGAAIEGFGLSDAVALWGDEIARVAEWKGGHDVSRLAGKAVRLRFVMQDADLYSIRFRE